MFVHLHNHTQDGSLLDGLSKIPELVSKVKSMGMNACAMELPTDWSLFMMNVKNGE